MNVKTTLLLLLLLVTSRLKCAAISFHELSRSSVRPTDGNVPWDDSPIALHQLASRTSRAKGKPIVT